MVGILLITHSGIGRALTKTLALTFGTIPLRIEELAIESDPDPEKLVQEAAKIAQRLDQGSGVLILTDMYGSTPSNIALKLQTLKLQTRVIAGLNLPMLFKILNYSHLSLPLLAAKAMHGGREGIVETKSHRGLIYVNIDRLKKHKYRLLKTKTFKRLKHV
ncbi:MAG TPA: PTS fructose transporter subunit IIA [Gammaproteobacteria bacterium]|nr:PTS fructose transporter subunit IIA [Gammaproteobacteria bacterium]